MTPGDRIDFDERYALGFAISSALSGIGAFITGYMPWAVASVVLLLIAAAFGVDLWFTERHGRG